MALSLPSDTFDLVSSNEVLEHVPDLDKALHEICRVLKSGGWHIGTCPFRFMDEQSQRRARFENGRLIHMMEPEFHGNPMSTSGSLVFETPGWDILRRCKEAGFAVAAMRFVMSKLTATCPTLWREFSCSRVANENCLPILRGPSSVDRHGSVMR